MLKCCQNDVDIMLEWCWQWCQNDAGMVPECFGDTTKMLSKLCQTDDKLMLERCQNHARVMLMSEWCWHAARIVLKLYHCQWIAKLHSRYPTSTCLRSPVSSHLWSEQSQPILEFVESYSRLGVLFRFCLWNVTKSAIDYFTERRSGASQSRCFHLGEIAKLARENVQAAQSQW